MNRSKVAVVASSALGKIASVVGFVMGACSLIVIIVGITDMDTSGAVAAIVLLSFVFAFSVFLIAKGSQIKRRIRRFKHYVFLISKRQMTSLDKIAAEMMKSVKFVNDDLQMMIRRKFFTAAIINTVTNEIIIGGAAAAFVADAMPTGMAAAIGAAAAGAAAGTAAAGSAQNVMEVYICSGCGASGAKQKGEIGRCEYCGSAVV